jgi:hypothetical protein
MKKTFLTFVALLLTFTFFAQQKKVDTLRTDEIIVVKPYTPKISDAFKIKDTPSIRKTAIEKDTVKYTFFTFPVASIFMPIIGTAKSVVRQTPEKTYDNFVAGGFGNFSTAYVESFIHSNTSKYNDFGVFIKHLSSSGGVKDILLNNSYSDTDINLYYNQSNYDYDWQVNGGFQNQSQYWYGLPKDLVFDSGLLSDLDAKQKYLNIFTSGSLSFVDGGFKNISIDINHFSDNFSSSEFHVLSKAKFEFPVASESILANASLEYLNSKFELDYDQMPGSNYSLMNLGFEPNYKILREDFSVNIGAKVYYSFDLEKDRNQFYLYPNLTGSYKVMDNALILIAGVTGDLTQNSNKSFTSENAYISPTINLNQTDEQYKAYFGAKGKVMSNISYNITASYASVNDQALFISNPSRTNGLTPITYGYEAGNSFGIVYDDVTIINFLAGANVDLTQEFKVGGTIEFNNYSMTNQSEAWNLPAIKSTLFGNYNTKKWYAGTDIYIVGNRKDYIIPTSGIPSVKDLDMYVDINLNGGYLFTNRLTTFIKFNNLLSSNYERYSNFDVQGFQFLGGVIYKFNL